MKPFNALFVVLVLSLVVSACGPANTPVPSPTPEPDLGPVKLVWSITGGHVTFNTPTGLALDGSGNLYVVDTLNHQVGVFNADGAFVKYLGGSGSGEGHFNFAWKDNLDANEQDEVAASVAFDEAGNIYVTDVGNNRIQKFDSDGNFLAQWQTMELEGGKPSQPHDIAINRQGNIFVVDRESFITKYDSSGNFLLRWGGFSAEGGFTGEAGFLALDTDGSLYISHIFRSTILKFDGDGNRLAEFELPGKESQFAGNDPSIATPFGVFVDAKGNIYATDYLNNRVLVLDRDGQLLMEWGRQGADAGLLYGPVDIAVDANGNMYVSETYNNRVQKFSPKQ